MKMVSMAVPFKAKIANAEQLRSTMAARRRKTEGRIVSFDSLLLCPGYLLDLRSQEVQPLFLMKNHPLSVARTCARIK